MCNYTDTGPPTRNYTDPEPVRGYGIRRCRGHWHVIDMVSGFDLSLGDERFDCFLSRDAALDAAARLNAEMEQDDALQYEPELKFDGYLKVGFKRITLELPPSDFD